MKKIIKIFLIIFFIVMIKLIFFNNADNEILSKEETLGTVTQKVNSVFNYDEILKKLEEKELENCNSKSIYVYDLTDDKEIKNLNADEKLYPASLVKIMTTYVALKNINNLSEFAPIDKNSYKSLIAANSSMAGFVSFEKTTYRDLLYGTILASAGECADSLAINICGSEDAFVEKMNKVVREIGLNRTNYKNVTGLDAEGQYQSAKDVGLLLKHCLEDENFRAIFNKKEFLSSQTSDHPDGLYMESTVFKKLKNYGYDGFEIIGGKSGTTSKAGLCLATLAVKNNKEYIVVVMGVPYDDISDTGDGQIEDTLEILKKL